MPELYCGKCRRGHILVDGVWIRCRCLIERELKQKAISMGVPADFSFTRVVDIPSSVPALEDLKKQFFPLIDPPILNGKVLLLHEDFKEDLAYMIFVWFVSMGFKGVIDNLEHCADYFVNKQRDIYKGVREAPVLVLFFGREMVSQVHRNMLPFLVEFRSYKGFFTILVFEKQFQDMARMYGKEVYTVVTDPNKIKVISCKSLSKMSKLLRGK